MSKAADIAQALGRGKEVQSSSNSWNTLCPTHGDDNPSLTVTDTNDGKVLVRCHAGCDQTAVIDTLREMGLWRTQAQSRVWKALDYVPDTVSFPTTLTHSKYGAPTGKWEYRDRKGRLVGYTCRFDKPDGGKEILPLAYCICEQDQVYSWRWKWFNKPRTLYRVHLLDRPEGTGKRIVVVEGEKTAEAAQLILGDDYLVLTWPGGSNAVKFANWEILKGLDVIIWPDADAPGAKAAAAISEILTSLEVKSVKLVHLPETLPEGWDLADPIPEGVDMDIKGTIATAQVFVPTGDVIMDDMNKKFALTILGDKTMILWERWDPIRKRNMPNYISITAMNQYLSNQTVPSGRRQVPVADYWMKHPERKTYDGVVFEPGADTERFYNLWRGYTYEPDQTGEWDIFEEHMRLNVTNGDDKLYEWTMAWFAQMLQQPRNKPGTSIAFRGKQGTGKTVVGQHMGALVRDNYVYVDDPRYVLGNFNSHMVHSLLLQADEGFFAGDPRHIGRLKGMVTADTNRIEYKGKDSFEINNYMRLLITSNSSWIIPAAFEERRFAVLDVGDARMQDKAFFKAMDSQLKNGGYGGLLHHLLNMDISAIDVGTVPHTAALNDQKHYTMDSVIKFWFERIRDAEITQFRGDWPEHVSCEELYSAYTARCKQWGVYRPVTDSQFGRELREVVGEDMTRSRRRVDCFDDRGVLTKDRKWSYAVPQIKAARKYFDETMNTTYAWERFDQGIIDPDDKDLDPPF